jgi:hypothetical protein
MHPRIHRDLAVGIGTIFATLLVAAGVFSYFIDNGRAVSRPAVTETADVPFTPLIRGSESSVTERVNYIITSKEELALLWDMINATTTEPSIDFNTQAVLAIFAGQQLVAGTDIAVAKIEDAAKRLVSITIARPTGSCTEKRSATTPYEIIKVPLTSLTLAHEDLRTTVRCP